MKIKFPFFRKKDVIDKEFKKVIFTTKMAKINPAVIKSEYKRKIDDSRKYLNKIVSNKDTVKLLVYISTKKAKEINTYGRYLIDISVSEIERLCTEYKELHGDYVSLKKELEAVEKEYIKFKTKYSV